MYGESPDDRDDRPAAPLGVKIVVIILLVCGLALALLPLTVILLGGEDDVEAPTASPSVTTAPAESGEAQDADGEPEQAETAALPSTPDDELSPTPEPRPDTAKQATRRGPFTRPDGWSEKWDPWFEHIDWVVGPEAGMAAARESGKPMMLFYTATW